MPQLWQRSVSLRDGIATKKPLAPSMIFRSRMTNMSSNVMLQKACKPFVAARVVFHELDADFSDLHSRYSFTRRSLLLRGRRSRPGPILVRAVRGSSAAWLCRGRVAAQAEIGRAAATHQGPVERRAQVRQGVPDPSQFGLETLRRRVEAG